AADRTPGRLDLGLLAERRRPRDGVPRDRAAGLLRHGTRERDRDAQLHALGQLSGTRLERPGRGLCEIDLAVDLERVTDPLDRDGLSGRGALTERIDGDIVERVRLPLELVVRVGGLL